MFGLGGVFALALRTELLTPHRTVMDAMTYNRMFTLHGVTMVWLFLVPSIPTAFGNFILPIQLGARDLAFPKLNYQLLHLHRGPARHPRRHGGRAAPTPAGPSTRPTATMTPTRLVPVVSASSSSGISTILTGDQLHRHHPHAARAGNALDRIPLFVWTIYGTSIIMVLATPVLGMSLLLVALDHGFGWASSIPRWAAIRCCSSTSSGSTLTRPSTS